METASPVAISLREAGALVGFEVLADAEFLTLGFLIDTLEGMLTFVEDARFLSTVQKKRCVAGVLTTRQLGYSIEGDFGIAICDDPRRSFFLLQNALAGSRFYGNCGPTQVSDSACIHPRAAIADSGVTIGPHVTVGANAVIETGTHIERGATVHAGAVLGAAGFQTLRNGPEFIEMAHAGGVLIEEDAVIFANSTIARGLFRQSTRIGPRARIGNNAFVSHNVTIGSNSFVGHGAVINGNTHIGRECWLGPGAVVANGVVIGDRAFVTLGSVVVSNLDADARVSGNFAQPHKLFLRQMAQAR